MSERWDSEKYEAAIDVSSLAVIEYNRITNEIEALCIQRQEATRHVLSALANVAAYAPLDKDLREFAIYLLSKKGFPFTWLQVGFNITEEQYQEILAKGKRDEYQQRLEQLSTMPYLDYLRTPEWQERRKRILQRDSYHCQVCFSTEHLNVHHRTYERRGNENDGDLTTLCQGCHQVFHENGRLVKVAE